MALIKAQKLAHDSWQRLEAPKDAQPPVAFPEGDLLIALPLWRSQREELLALKQRLGLWLRGDDDPADVADDLAHFDLIAVHFTSFTDGRGYSIGRLLRERYGWKGELRATGDVQRDQLLYLHRCGFDAFDLRENEDVAVALRAFADFSESYQAGVDQSLPLFRRRGLSPVGA